MPHRKPVSNTGYHGVSPSEDTGGPTPIPERPTKHCGSLVLQVSMRVDNRLLSGDMSTCLHKKSFLVATKHNISKIFCDT